MKKDLHSEKIDRHVKDVLSGMEEKYNPTHWEEMEKMLSSQPSTIKFKWSYIINSFIAAGVLAGGYFLVHSISSSSKEMPSATTTITPVEKPVSPAASFPSVVSQPKTAVNDNSPEIVVSEKNSPVEETIKEDNNKQEEHTVEKPIKETIADGSAISEESLPKTTGTAATENSSTEDFSKLLEKAGTERIIFGDQIDPVKGVISSSSEREELKRLAATKDPLSWEGLKLSDLKKDSIHKRSMADSILKLIQQQKEK